MTARERRPSNEASAISTKVDQIIQHAYSKAAQVIVQSRLTHIDPSHGRPASGMARRESQSSTASLNKRVDKWFNLETEDIDIFKDELKTWRSAAAHLSSPSGSVPSMVLDILLDVNELNQSQALVLNAGHLRTVVSQANCNIVLERWTVSVLPAPPSTSNSTPELPTLYKQGIILFRTLYAVLRTFPAYDLSRRIRKRRGQGQLKIGVRMSTSTGIATPPISDESEAETQEDAPYKQSRQRKEYGLGDSLDESSGKSTKTPADTDTFTFAPIITPLGSLFVECKYRRNADFSVHDTEALLSSRFLNEDYFKPSVDPSRPTSQPTQAQGMQRTRSLLGHGTPPAIVSALSQSPARPASERPFISQEGAFLASSPLAKTQSGGAGSASPISISGTKELPRGSTSPASYRLRGSLNAYTYSQPSSSLRYSSFSRRQSSEGTSPAFQSSSLSSSRPSFPRYTWSRYGRSFGQSSGDRSAAASPQPWEASSTEKHATTPATSSGASVLETADVDDIGNFLQMIDSRPQLSASSIPSASVMLTRVAAEERLRRLAASRDLEVGASPSRSQPISGQPIEEEPESAAASPVNLRAVSPANRPTRHTIQPSSFPRYEQTAQRAKPNIQTGFFHSTSTSPEMTGETLERPFSNPSSMTNRTTPAFPRYIPLRARTPIAVTPVSTTEVSGEAVDAYLQETMGQLELSLEEARPRARLATDEQSPWPSLPALNRGRARPLSHSRAARTPPTHSSVSSIDESL